MTTARPQITRMRPAHTPGPTFLAYTPNGRKLISVGSNNTIRVFETGSDGEPTNFDDCQDSNLAVVASNDFFITGSEDGSVCKFSFHTNSLDQILTRCTLPIRDLALTPDYKWVAVGSDEMTVKIVNTADMSRVVHLRDLPAAVKHLSFDPDGTTLSVTLQNGDIRLHVFDPFASTVSDAIKVLIGIGRALDGEEQGSARAVWHPDGRAFGVATATRDVQVVSKNDWERQKSFKGQHLGELTALAWSPNGGLLVTAASDGKVCLWETKNQSLLHSTANFRGIVLAFSWHPVENILSYTNTEGELYIHTDFVPAEHIHILEKRLQPAPFIHDPLGEISGNMERQNRLVQKGPVLTRPTRPGTPDSLDEILGPEDESDDGFIVDDDGAGYNDGVNGFGKRGNEHLGAYNKTDAKRRARGVAWEPQYQPAFQVGSTPWRGNRRYLCLNLLGFAWIVDQDTHHTVTIEFFDREFQREFHFTDNYSYNKACLSEKGTLFSCDASDDHPALIYYRPHETWTNRVDWRISLPLGESVTSLALSESYIVATTSAEYVRVYTLFGTPFKVYRQKSSPTVTCAAWRDYVMTIGNGSWGGRLLYTIENIKRGEVYQAEDIVALRPGTSLAAVFFSDAGDPCIYDSDGVLLVLVHWRIPGQARWVPLLDTRQLRRLVGGKKEETYWPMAVAQNKFHCIILKGGDHYPYFPRPLLDEFPFEMPLHTTAADADEVQGKVQSLEQAYVRESVLLSLLEDVVSATNATQAQRAELGQKSIEIDKTLLQLLAEECVQGDERSMKGLEIVKLLRDKTGRVVDAAGKVASRFGRELLADKIRELAERRLIGMDNDDGV